MDHIAEAEPRVAERTLLEVFAEAPPADESVDSALRHSVTRLSDGQTNKDD